MIHPDMTEAEVPSRIAELERRCSELEASRAADLESAVLLAQYLATLDKRLADIEGSEAVDPPEAGPTASLMFSLSIAAEASMHACGRSQWFSFVSLPSSG